MNRVLNLEMMANPFNWAIIYLVVVFCGIAIRAVTKVANTPNASA